MSLGFGFGFPKNYVAAAFSPASLFTQGEQGAWYDPSDLTTLFQDSTGTTPCTLPGQGAAMPVGLMLDKSKGLVLGPELVTGVWSGTGNAQDGTVFSGDDNEYWGTQFSTVVGRAYRFTAVMSSKTGNSQIRFRNGIVGSGSALYASNNDALPVTVNVMVFATSTTSNVEILFRSAGSSVTVTNISVRELPGNHAFQATPTSRPTLSARVNLLTQTEAFDNAVYLKKDMAVVADQAAAPDGTTTADKITPNAANATHYVFAPSVSSVASAVYSLYVKANGYTKIALRESATAGSYASFDLSNGTVIETGNVAPGSVASAGIQSVGNGWYRIYATFSGTANQLMGIWPLPPSYTTGNPTFAWVPNGTDGFFIWGADLRVANDTGSTVPSYQRVVDANTYDTAGFPLYLAFDGSDDWLQTNSIDFSQGATNAPLGPELVTNGGPFSSATGITLVNTTTSFSDGVMTLTGGRAEWSLSGLTVGKSYRAVIRARRVTGTAQRIQAWTWATVQTTALTDTFADYSFTLTATATSGLLRIYADAISDPTSSVAISSVSVKELTDTAYAPDKMTAFVGLRKLSDAARGMIIELSASGANVGAFAIDIVPPAYRIFGVSNSGSASSSLTVAAPSSRVVTGQWVGNTISLRENGVVGATGAQVSANFGNYPLYIGCRGGTTLPFTGRIYGMVIRGAQSTTAQITSTETYLNTKMGRIY